MNNDRLIDPEEFSSYMEQIRIKLRQDPVEGPKFQKNPIKYTAQTLIDQGFRNPLENSARTTQIMRNVERDYGKEIGNEINKRLYLDTLPGVNSLPGNYKSTYPVTGSSNFNKGPQEDNIYNTPEIREGIHNANVVGTDLSKGVADLTVGALVGQGLSAVTKGVPFVYNLAKRPGLLAPLANEVGHAGIKALITTGVITSGYLIDRWAANSGKGKTQYGILGKEDAAEVRRGVQIDPRVPAGSYKGTYNSPIEAIGAAGLINDSAPGTITHMFKIGAPGMVPFTYRQKLGSPIPLYDTVPKDSIKTESPLPDKGWTPPARPAANPQANPVDQEKTQAQKDQDVLDAIFN
ncbi:MAG TPA: hypothetical protein PL124_09645 [Candidatus Cloacimonadota bacterium]|nr:hypothetical protein [Candidatus Cloacimonadota bacterium]